MRKTGNKWETEKCGRCDEPHSGYSGKLDINGTEYVICGNANKRINVSGVGKEGNSIYFPTLWKKILS